MPDPVSTRLFLDALHQEHDALRTRYNQLHAHHAVTRDLLALALTQLHGYHRLERGYAARVVPAVVAWEPWPAAMLTARDIPWGGDR